MTCDDARELLSVSLDGALTAEERSELEAHLAGCAECPRELEQLRKTVALLHGVEPARAPAGFVDRVLAAAPPTPWYRRWGRRLGAPLPMAIPIQAAALVLVALTAVYLWETAAPDLGSLQEVARPRESFPVARDAFKSAARPPAPTAETEPPGAPAKERRAPMAEGDRGGRRVGGLGGLAAKAPVQERADVPASAPSTAASRVLSAPAPERLDETREQKPERARAAPVPAESELAAELARPPDVSGRLAVGDRRAATRALARLVAELGGVEVSRRQEPDMTAVEIVEVVVPRAGYAEFAASLGRIGRWAPDREPSALPPQVRVSLRITE